VRDRLRGEGEEVLLLDTRRFPESLHITLGDRPEHIEIDGRRVRARSVYVRDLGLNPVTPGAQVDEREMAADWRTAVLALRERSDVITSVVQRWEAAGVPVYNPQSVRYRITKPLQLALLAAAGLPVPESRWTNRPEDVRAFAAGRRIAYKPVAGGAATRELFAEDLRDERLELLAGAPVCFQELLPGEDIRAYLVDGEFIASYRIVTDALDFRQNEQALEPYALAPEVVEQCKRALAVLGLRFTGMDLKADERGELKILELNPSPMFLGFDARAGTDVLGSLCRALRQPSSGQGG
jgi:glutathione synthase/RimK-type ligase-like ATP-grasp enzyme